MNQSMVLLQILQEKVLLTLLPAILSFAMALRYSLDLDNEADSLEKAVQDVLNDGLKN